MDISYSQKDNGFIAHDPERPGLSAFSETKEEAEQEFKIAEKLWKEDREEEEFYQHVSAMENKIRDSLEKITKV